MVFHAIGCVYLVGLLTSLNGWTVAVDPHHTNHKPVVSDSSHNDTTYLHHVISDTTETVTSGEHGDVSILSIPLTSWVSICYARCLARVDDFLIANLPTYARASFLSSNQLKGPEYAVCLHFLNTNWLSDCQDRECIESCRHNISSSQPGNPTPPDLLSDIGMSQKDPQHIKLSWVAVTTNTYTVRYVLESRNTSSSKWQLVDQTYETGLTLSLSPCEERAYRVAAVNQFGTHGFSPKAIRSEFPRPGVVKVKSWHRVRYDGRYFWYSFDFSRPEGWLESDIEDFVSATHYRFECTHTILPPQPSPAVFSRNAETFTLQIRVHSWGYGCRYQAQVAARTVCGVSGEKLDFYVDLTDCEDIAGYECPTEPDDNGIAKVNNVTAVVQEDSGDVLVSWQKATASHDTGYYLVQWGTANNSVLNLHEEGRIKVNRTQLNVMITVQRFGIEYLVKVVAGVERGPLDDETLSMMTPQASFKVPLPAAIETEPDLLAVYIAVPCAAVAVILVALITVIVRKHRQKQQPKYTASQHAVLNYMPFKLHKQAEGDVDTADCDEWEVARDSLTLGETLGQGAFGQVVKGSILLSANPRLPSSCTARLNPLRPYPMTVAVKMLHDIAGAAHREDFLKEIALMKQIGTHPNVVSLVGCVTRSNAPVCLIVEHMSGGDLLRYLRAHRLFLHDEGDVTSTAGEKLTLSHLLGFARQIAVGMVFLSEKNLVHRDLATRNILVGEGHVVKIGDFGLTRFVHNDDVYVTRHGGKLPLKWMAPESIVDLVFNTNTDIWSYGVVLWELVTFGATPYPSISNRHLMKYLQRGGRLDKPEACPENLYDIMLKCWENEPTDRPSFGQVYQDVDRLLHGAVDADYLNLELSSRSDFGIVSSSGGNTSVESVFHTPCASRGVSQSETSSFGDDVTAEQVCFDENETCWHDTNINHQKTRNSTASSTQLIQSDELFKEHHTEVMTSL